MKAYIICANDGIESVVFGNEELAEQVKEKLAHEYYEKNKGQIINSVTKDEKDYRKICYWHLHCVDIVKDSATDENMIALLDSCVEGKKGEWDCSNDEGKAAFMDMYELLTRVAKTYNININGAREI